MAGESPDRSKQRESSEEPTSGSAGPVPGARSESGTGARDPRLAVARDREPTPRGGVDTATRVFSRRDLPPEEGTEPTPADGTGDARLGTATAERVPTADEGEPEGAEDAAAGAGPDAESAPDGDTTTAADAPESGEEPARAPTPAAGPASDSEAPEKAPEAPQGPSGGPREVSSEPKSAQESTPKQTTPAPESKPTPNTKAADAPGATRPPAAADATRTDTKATSTPGAPQSPATDADEVAETPTTGTTPATATDTAETGDAEPRPSVATSTSASATDAARAADADAADEAAAAPRPSGATPATARAAGADAADADGAAPRPSGTNPASATDAAPAAGDAETQVPGATPTLTFGATPTRAPAAGAARAAAADADAEGASVPAAGTEAASEASGASTRTSATAAVPATGADADPRNASAPAAGAEASAEAAGAATRPPATGATSAPAPAAGRSADAEGAAIPAPGAGNAAEAGGAPTRTSVTDAAPATPAAADPSTEGASSPAAGAAPAEAGGVSASASVAGGAAGAAAARAGGARTPGWARAADADARAEADEVPAKGTTPATDDGTPAPPTAADADTPAEADRTPDTDPTPDTDRTPKPPVDQPTAVFKAVRPPVAPSVDQPTTMLKLGDVPAGKAKAVGKPESGDEVGAPAGAGGGSAESVSERTSKFVALRQLDDPATRKPPVAPAAPAAPTANAPAAAATAAIPQVGPERTTQQPLPPLPPLDLLAELTNTPPPPNTPVRTIVRRVKIWTPLVILLAIIFAVVQTLRPLPTPELTLTADDSYTFDGKAATLPWPSEGQGWMDVNGIGTMGNFGEQTPVAIGSVAKAMTAYIVLKDHPLKVGEDGPKITIDATAEKEGGYYKDNESTLNTVKEGDTLTLKQALSAVMIPSANNIARLLARWDAGTEAAFIKKMNDTAKELGMKNTTYTDASGLKETTVSSAEDQVKLGHELVRIPALMDITKQPYWYDPSGQKWRNYNDLVPYNGAIGIKTGTTTAAGGNLLFAGTKEVGGETVTVVGAILGQHTAPIIDTVNNVSETALIAAGEALLSSKILKKGDVVGYVDDGLGGHTPVVLSKDVTAVGWAGLKVELSFAAADDLPHSAKAGTSVGTLTVGDGSGSAVEVPVQLQKDLVEPGFDKKLTRVG